MEEISHYHRSPRHVYSFCCLRAKKLAMLVHATSRIPLSERQIIDIEERMFKSASVAEDDTDVTRRVNDVQDAFISETTFRTPAMWKFCRNMATVLAVRLSIESKLTIAERSRTARILCRRMFKAASRSTNDDDVNARLGNVYNAALAEHGIALEL
jgi:hypothetical protein